MFRNNDNEALVREFVEMRLRNEGFINDTPERRRLFQKMAGFPYERQHAEQEAEAEFA